MVKKTVLVSLKLLKVSKKLFKSKLPYNGDENVRSTCRSGFIETVKGSKKLYCWIKVVPIDQERDPWDQQTEDIYENW